MKKRICLIMLVLAMLATLCGCGETKKAQEALDAAHTLIGQEKYSEAIETLKPWTEYNDNIPNVLKSAYFFLAEDQFEAGEIESALENYELSGDFFESTPDYIKDCKAIIKFKEILAGDPMQAAEKFNALDDDTKDVILFNPQSNKLAAEVVSKNVADGKFDEAFAIADLLEYNSEIDEKTWYDIGKHFADNGNWVNCLKAVERCPSDKNAEELYKQASEYAPRQKFVGTWENKMQLDTGSMFDSVVNYFFKGTPLTKDDVIELYDEDYTIDVFSTLYMNVQGTWSQELNWEETRKSVDAMRPKIENFNLKVYEKLMQYTAEKNNVTVEAIIDANNVTELKDLFPAVAGDEFGSFIDKQVNNLCTNLTKRMDTGGSWDAYNDGTLSIKGQLITVVQPPVLSDDGNTMKFEGFTKIIGYFGANPDGTAVWTRVSK